MKQTQPRRARPLRRTNTARDLHCAAHLQRWTLGQHKISASSSTAIPARLLAPPDPPLAQRAEKRSARTDRVPTVAHLRPDRTLTDASRPRGLDRRPLGAPLGSSGLTPPLSSFQALCFPRKQGHVVSRACVLCVVSRLWLKGPPPFGQRKMESLWMDGWMFFKWIEQQLLK